MSRKQFVATHTITTPRHTYTVMLCANPKGGGPAYTRAEWDSYSAADWERTPEGKWLFQGAAVEGAEVKEGVATGCLHPRKRILRDRAFAGAVAKGADENRAAHGNITREEECRDCGATRSLNLNGRHAEVGAWLPPPQALKV